MRKEDIIEKLQSNDVKDVKKALEGISLTGWLPEYEPYFKEALELHCVLLFHELGDLEGEIKSTKFGVNIHNIFELGLNKSYVAKEEDGVFILKVSFSTKEFIVMCVAPSVESPMKYSLSYFASFDNGKIVISQFNRSI